MQTIEPLIIKTYKAAASLRKASDAQIKKTLKSLADAVEENIPSILKANKKDIEKQEPANPKIDRLLLNEQRIKAIANAIRSLRRRTHISAQE